MFFVSDCFDSILGSSVLPLLVFFYCLLLSINSLYEYTIQSFFFNNSGFSYTSLSCSVLVWFQLCWVRLLYLVVLLYLLKFLSLFDQHKI